MDVYQKYLESALHFLSYRMRSEKEVRDNLVKKAEKHKGILSEVETSEAIERVITWLKEQRFVNDEEFARQWIESRARSKPKSLMVIKLELRRKGVGKDIIERVAKDPETEVGSDYSRAKRLAEKKFPKYKHLSKQEVYQKLGGVLARNGFDWDTIKRSIDDILAVEYNSR